MEKEYICVAICRKQHGVRGEIKASVLLDNPKDIKKISALKTENDVFLRKIERCFAISNEFGFKLEGINSVDEALKLKNKKLYALRSEVDALKSNNLIYIEDIINKVAYFEDGEMVGKITDVENFGANDIVYIESVKYKNLCFANIGGIILEVNEDKVILNKEEFNKVYVCD